MLLRVMRLLYVHSANYVMTATSQMMRYSNHLLPNKCVFCKKVALNSLAGRLDFVSKAEAISDYLSVALAILTIIVCPSVTSQ